MPGFILTQAAMVMCPHAAPATLLATGVRVLLSGQPVALLADQTIVAGCPLSSLPVPSPCLTVTWLTGSTRLLVGGQPVLLQDSLGLAKNPSQAPQGPPLVLMTQMRASGG